MPDLYRVESGALIITPDPDSSRAGRAAMHLLAGLEWRRQVTRHPSGAYGITTTEPLHGGMAYVWRAAESILGRGVFVDLGTNHVCQMLDDELRARLAQALLMAWGVQIAEAVR